MCLGGERVRDYVMWWGEGNNCCMIEVLHLLESLIKSSHIQAYCLTSDYILALDRQDMQPAVPHPTRNHDTNKAPSQHEFLNQLRGPGTSTKGVALTSTT